MKEYRLLTDGVLRVADSTVIPNDEGNPHWQTYREWIRAGNSPDPIYSADEEIDIAKRQKMIEINASFLAASTAPVSAAGIPFTGGHDTLIEIMQEKQLAQLLGASKCIVFDADGNEIQLSFVQADNLLTVLANAYRPQLRHKFDLRRQVMAAATIEQVQAIAW